MGIGNFMSNLSSSLEYHQKTISESLKIFKQKMEAIDSMLIYHLVEAILKD